MYRVDLIKSHKSPLVTIENVWTRKLRQPRIKKHIQIDVKFKIFHSISSNDGKFLVLRRTKNTGLKYSS